jgi:hypothetical protein
LLVETLAVKEFVETLEGKSELEITVKGRRPKKAHSITVWFIHEKNEIYLLPLKGSETEWYKNVLKDPDITLTVDGSTIQAEAKPITETDRVQQIVKLFAAKYGGMSEINRWYSNLDVAIAVTPLPTKGPKMMSPFFG